jgi:hypothetical protein
MAENVNSQIQKDDRTASGQVENSTYSIRLLETVLEEYKKTTK